MARPIQIAPSVLPADFARLGDEVAALEEAGCDLIQWDVMDGNFVPNLTFGPDVIAAARRHTSLPFEAHLMVTDPDLMAARYVEAGCSRLIVHAESTTHLHRSLGLVNELGAAAAVALNPSTPASSVEHVLDLVDLVLVMTVNPGFGGQKFIPATFDKLREARRIIDESGFDIRLEIDGGVKVDNIREIAEAGADTFVSGSAIFGSTDYAATIAKMRSELAQAGNAER